MFTIRLLLLLCLAFAACRTECRSGETRCAGEVPENCSDGLWQAEPACGSGSACGVPWHDPPWAPDAGTSAPHGCLACCTLETDGGSRCVWAVSTTPEDAPAGCCDGKFVCRPWN